MARLHVTIYAEDAHLDRVLESVQTRTVVVFPDDEAIDLFTQLDDMAGVALEQLRKAANDIDRRRRAINERTI